MGAEGRPLYLTPYIEEGNLEEGRQASEVKPLLGNIKSHSGFFTVNKELGAHMFFWYFPSETRPEEAPLLVWLNGWATPSSYGIFLQNGPYEYNGDQLRPRQISWQKWYNVLYIDNPVGIGFSHCTGDAYSRDLNSIGINLYWTLSQFLQLFPSLRKNDLYLCGISFAGKYLSYFAHHIAAAGKVQKTKINLKGIFIGNPYMDPFTQLKYSEYLFNLGLIDHNEKLNLMKHEDQLQSLLRDKRGLEAYELLLDILFRDDNYLKESTGLKHIFDFTRDDITVEHWRKYIQSEKARSHLHVGSTDFSNGKAAFEMFKSDILTSANHILEELLLNYRVLFYNGQFDICTAYPMMADMLRSLEWPGASEFRLATRSKLLDKDSVFGYQKTVGNLTEVMIRNASHSAVTDKPEYVLQILNTFTNWKTCEK